MTEIMCIKILCACVGLLGTVLVMLHRENDRLRDENKELLKRLMERK